jgi:hypothetical protein
MSKLSLHISDWLNPDLTYDFIERTRPPVIKVFGDVGLDDVKIGEAKRRSPSTLVVGRMYFPEQRIERDERSPEDTVLTYDPIADARNAFNQMRGIMDKTRGLVNVWESYNEIAIDTAEPLTDRERIKAKNYNAFTVEMARLMHADGQQYAAYSFSTGNPVHIELWDLLLDGLRASDYLALHEYIAPNEEWTDFFWGMCNRYRQIYDHVPADARRPVLITECGADYLGQQGFKGKISVPQYMSMMARYDQELMRDPYVVGAVIYCYGINAPQWRTYDIGGDFARVLREHIIQTPTPPLEVPPVLTPEPPPASRAPGLLMLAEVLALTRQAREKLLAGDGDIAHGILKDTIVPWFYASAPQHSTDLPNAQAHTQARWFTEEAVRRIEASDLVSARELIDANVLPWLESPGPRELGILGKPTKKKLPAKKRPARKRRLTKKPPLLLSAGSKPAPKTPPKPNRSP